MPCASARCSLAGVCPNSGSLPLSPCVHPPCQPLAAGRGPICNPLRKVFPTAPPWGSAGEGICPSLPPACLTPRLPRSGIFWERRWPKQAAEGVSRAGLVGLPCWRVEGPWLQHPSATSCWVNIQVWLMLEEKEGVLSGMVASPHPISWQQPREPGQQLRLC